MRIRNKAWITIELAENEALLKNPGTFRGKWRDYFKELKELGQRSSAGCAERNYLIESGNRLPLYVEIGCGKGGYSTKTASSNPDVYYVAIERSPKVAAFAVKRYRQLEQPPKNLVFVCSDADSLRELFEPGEIDRIYLNFCDPWPNRAKWAKRRLTYRKYLNIYSELLRPSGELFFKTDNSELFEFSVTEFEATGWVLRNISRDLHGEDLGRYSDHVTEYEEKFSGKGVKINRCEAVAPNASYLSDSLC